MNDTILIREYKKKIKIMENMIKAQEKLLINYRTGCKKSPPEWVFKAIEKYKNYFAE